jgi:hypothetical protein
VGLTPSATSVVEAAVEPRVIQLRGASDTDFAHDIIIKGLTVARSAPTFMKDYEMPSGGDWSIHRGGAIFLDGTEWVKLNPPAGSFWISDSCTTLTKRCLLPCRVYMLRFDSELAWYFPVWQEHHDRERRGGPGWWQRNLPVKPLLADKYRR